MELLQLEGLIAAVLVGDVHPRSLLGEIAVGIFILLHQLITWGKIDYDQILHHEWFAAVLISFAIGAIYIIGTKKFIARMR